ncbi:hypothetical protein P4534_13815 [Peribacillus butanolivorans]|uniref:hypothetical protein n=1 Tax=Peribacillus butanolivorans TaxID=421767 RepID=UPI0012FC5703|nr:hypothetical protein [Peribacillus butanolivorans]MED3689879.1 hypothetical protein [Peribacillus butanolivorans]
MKVVTISTVDELVNAVGNQAIEVAHLAVHSASRFLQLFTVQLQQMEILKQRLQ